MTGGWNFVSEDAQTISLHDCRVSRVEAGEDLTLYFDTDGFDVTRDNPLNPTGRHRNTGPAAVVLEGGRFLDGAFGRGASVMGPDGQPHPLPETPVTGEQFWSSLEMVILDFDWDPKEHILRLFGGVGADGSPPDAEGFVEIALAGERLLFCWNDLPWDAWFQDQPGKM